MITALRKHAQSWLIKVLLFLIAITFVVGFSIGRFTSSSTVLARVGSYEILINDFNREYEREVDRLRERFGDNADVVAAQLNTRKNVFDRMINRRLILSAANDQGLVVTEEELGESIKRQAFFQLDNRFDFATYRAVLAQNRLTPEEFEARTLNDLLAEKYRRNLLAGLVVGKEEVEQRYRIENEKVVVEAFKMEPEKFKNTVKSGAEAEQAYYDAHKDQFTQPDQYRLDYIVLPLDAVEANVTLKERALQRYYERYMEEKFSKPKRIRASHILKKVASDASLESAEKTRSELEAVLKKIRGGANFAALAKEHSEDLTKNKGGDLGVFTREDMLPEFSDAAFSLQVGEVSGIVRTNFGFHLIKVTEVTPSVVEPFDKVRPQIEKILRAQRAERKLKIEIERLPRRISEEGLEAVAASLKRELRQSGWVDGTGTVGKLGAAQGLYNVIRNSKKGDGGVWRRNPVQGHVFYQIAEKKASYLKPLAEVRKQVTEKVMSERMTEAALREAKSIYKTLKTYKDFKAAAKRQNVRIFSSEFSSVDRNIPEVGANREFQESAFRLVPGQPIGLSIDGKTAHLMILKKRHIPKPDDETEVKLNITARIQQQWAEYFLELELERLKGEIEIEVVTPELVSGL